MFVVGLTGGIGSGKSTVAALFARLGAVVVDTDVLAHRLTAPGGAALPPLIAAFGDGILAPDGSLNRAAMRQRVFTHPEARRQLEDILHPLIRQRAKAELAACAALSPPYALLAVPLLLETGGKTVYGLDRILLVDCPETLQVARVMARSALTKAEAEAILAAQTDRATRRAAADDILDNSGSPEALPAAVAHLHALYLQRIPKKESA